VTGSVYGRVITGADVRAAAQATLERWLPTYLAELARQKSLTLPPVRHYSTGIDPIDPGRRVARCGAGGARYHG
jgi:hypothetical protein